MKQLCSTKHLFYFWLMNLCFLCVSCLIPDSNSKQYGYLEYPTDQNIVCASGYLKDKNSNSLEEDLSFLLLGTTGNKKVKILSSPSKLETSKTYKVFFPNWNTHYKKRSKAFKDPRSPPLSYS